MSDEVVVEIRDLHKNYGPLEVLKGIDLTVGTVRLRQVHDASLH